MKTYSSIDQVEKMIGKIKEETAQMKKCLANDIFFTSGVNKIYENLRKLVRQMNNFVKSEHRREVI
jgi:hypothetical protein